MDLKAKEAFENLSLCMSDVGFAVGDRESIFEILAAILHLGNVDYVEGMPPTYYVAHFAAQKCCSRGH